MPPNNPFFLPFTLIIIILIIISPTSLTATSTTTDLQNQPDIGYVVPLCASVQILPEHKLRCKESGIQSPKIANSRSVFSCISDYNGARFTLSHDAGKGAWIIVDDYSQNIVAGIYSYAVSPELIKRSSPRAKPLLESGQEKGFEIKNCEDSIMALPQQKSSRNARTFFLDLIRTKEVESLPLFLGSFYSLVGLLKNPPPLKEGKKYCKGFGGSAENEIPIYFGHTSLTYLWCLDFTAEGSSETVPRWYFSTAIGDVGTDNCIASCVGNWILDSEFPSGCQFLPDVVENTNPTPSSWVEFSNVRSSWSSFEDDDDIFTHVIRWRADDWLDRAHPNTKALKLTNELEIPLIGLGTGGLDDKQTRTSLAAAFKAGYVLIDTASEYENEIAVGDAVSSMLPNGARGAFIMTKVWPVDLGFERTINSVMNSRNNLKVSVIDSVLLHWPKCFAEWNVEWMDCTDASPDNDPAHPLWRESWKALEKLYAEGIVLSIGVSNFDIDLLKQAVEQADAVAPQIVQNQFSLKNLDEDVVDYCRANGIFYMSYAMLRDGIDANERTALKKMIRERFYETSIDKQDELIRNERYVLMRWAIENNIAVIPRSRNAVHVKKNIENTLSMEWVASPNPETEDILDYPKYEQVEEL
jgi:diketogulonate reductase-like aldo/keto reductase